MTPTPANPTAVSTLLLLYDALWALVAAAWLAAMVLSARGMRGGRVGARLGRLPPRPRWAQRSIWIHAVSVGELASIRPLIAALKAGHPDWWVLLTAHNGRALELAQANPGGADAVCRMPWDFGPCIGTALDRARPDVLVLVECEFWPNLLHHAARRGVRMLSVNARVYPRDFPRYRAARRLFGPLLRAMSFLGAQSEADRRRLIALGADAGAVEVIASTKFDVSPPVSGAWDFRAELGFGSDPVWMLASTHPGEEEMILGRAAGLRRGLPGLRMIIAPRRPERAASVRATAERLGYRAILRSRPAASGSPPDVVVLDTMGELAALFPAADLVFVGGSLVPAGGHNPIEPAACGRAVLVGPHHENFEAVVRVLCESDAAIPAADADALIGHAATLLTDPERRAAMGRRAAQTVARNRGATGRYRELIERLAAPIAASPLVKGGRQGGRPSRRRPAPTPHFQGGGQSVGGDWSWRNAAG